MDQFVHHLVQTGVDVAGLPVVEEAVDAADEGGGGEAVVAGEGFAAFGGRGGLGADEVDPAGTAFEALALQAGLTPMISVKVMRSRRGSPVTLAA